MSSKVIFLALALVLSQLAINSPMHGQDTDWSKLSKVLDIKLNENRISEVVPSMTPTELAIANVDRSGLNSVSSQTADSSELFSQPPVKNGVGKVGEGVFVEYDGKLYPLKGFVQAPKRVAFTQKDKAELADWLSDEQKLVERFRTAQAVLRNLPANAPGAVRDKCINDVNTARKDLERNLDGRESAFSGLTSSRQLAEWFRLGRPVLDSDKQQVLVPTRVEDLNRPIGGAESAFATEGLNSVSNTTAATGNAAIVRNGNVNRRRPKFLLPAPADPNDLFYTPFVRPNASRLGLATEVASDSAASKALGFEDLYTSLRISPGFAAFYDTRTTADGFPIAALPTQRSATDGRTFFFGDKFQEVQLPTTLIWDTQTMSLGSQDNQVQLLVEANNHVENDELEIRHLYGRVWNTATTSVAAGKTQTLFGSNGLVPASLLQSTRLIGTSDLAEDNRVQIRVNRNFVASGRNLTYGVSIEDPLFSDFDNPNNTTALPRLPTIIGNVTLIGAHPVDRLQVGTMVRTVGLQDNATGAEFFESGWGLSLFGSKLLFDCDSSQLMMFGGICGGEGVGKYIQGVSHSAVFATGDIHVLESVGAFVGAQRRWVNQRGWVLNANLVYGYSMLDAPVGLVEPTTNNQLHHAFANLYVNTNNRFAYGLEWQWGRRETLGQQSGENSRLFFGFQITSQKPLNKASDIFIARGEQQITENALITDSQLYNARESRGSNAHLQGL